MSFNRKLPDAELEVMQVIWDLEPPVSRLDIENIITQKYPMATTTLLTLLSRLTDKEAISVEKDGRNNIYTPLVSRSDYLATQSKRFLDKLCSGNIQLFATALCDSGLSKDELEQLRNLLERDEL